MKTESEIQHIVKSLPNQPGVYLFLDDKAKIIYVGKAKNLKKRVSSYFVKKHESAKTRILLRKIADINHIIVESESDALLLENNLIKKHQPKYNVMLKDDKTYPWIVIKNEAFPRVFSTRNVIQDGSKYFGPYTSGRIMHTLLDLIRKLYPIRTCNYQLSRENILNNKFKVCLEYHIGNCKGPCVNEQSEENYIGNIEQIEKILKGHTLDIIHQLKHEMNEYAKKYQFEKAGEIKTKLEVLQNFQSKSTIVNMSVHNVDVFSIEELESYAYVNYLKVVKGAIVQTHTLDMKKRMDETQTELLTLAIVDIRNKLKSNASEILVPFKLDVHLDGVKIVVPQRGDKKKLLDLSIRNVKHYKQDKKRKLEKINPKLRSERLLEIVKKDLRLQELPKHIECFDNSNIQGSDPVAACVVFKMAKPSKKDYRHFNIKTVSGPDDFASMEEVVYRRYLRLQKENESLPQLIVIDGGKGQLNAAILALDKLGLRKKIAIIGIAKRLEEIYFPGDSIPVYLDKKSESLRLIQQLRDEAHRFGISFHRDKRSGNMIHSELDEIKGIGEKTRNYLLSEFKSIKEIESMSIEDLQKHIGKAKATLIYEYFRKSKKT